jgi:hypothetical protein
MTTLAEAQKSIERFIKEARQCAQQELGFASLCTLMPVVLSVSEALNPSPKSDKELIGAFVSEMSDTDSWIVAQLTHLSGQLGKAYAAEKLSDIRNGLAHSLSLPTDVLLANTNADAITLAQEFPNACVVSTTGLIDAVEETVQRLVQDCGPVTFDPRGRGTRNPAERIESWSVSASGANVGSASGSGVTGAPSSIPP